MLARYQDALLHAGVYRLQAGRDLERGGAEDLAHEQYERAKQTLREHMDGLTKLGNQLLEKEVIFSEDLEKIFGPRENHRTDLDGKPRSSRKSTPAREKASATDEPQLNTEKEDKEESTEDQTPRSKTA